MNDIYLYSDYTKFIKERLPFIKQGLHQITCRTMAQKLGVASAGHISQILNGKTPITPKMIAPFMSMIGVTKKREQAYFQLLHDYHFAGPVSEKRRLLREISLMTKSASVQLSSSQYAFYEKWYYAAIRDCITVTPFKGDYSKLARSVVPSISVQQAREAVEILRTLDLIKEDRTSGSLVATSKILEATLSDESRVVLSSYAEAMIEQAKYALNHLSAQERSISWAGFTASPQAYAQICDEIKLFRERVMAIVAQDEAAARVYHMNIQLFPISREASKEDQ